MQALDAVTKRSGGKLVIIIIVAIITIFLLVWVTTSRMHDVAASDGSSP